MAKKKPEIKKSEILTKLTKTSTKLILIFKKDPPPTVGFKNEIKRKLNVDLSKNLILYDNWNKFHKKQTKELKIWLYPIRLEKPLTTQSVKKALMDSERLKREGLIRVSSYTKAPKRLTP